MLADHAELTREHVNRIEDGSTEMGLRTLERVPVALRRQLLRCCSLSDAQDCLPECRTAPGRNFTLDVVSNLVFGSQYGASHVPERNLKFLEPRGGPMARYSSSVRDPLQNVEVWIGGRFRQIKRSRLVRLESAYVAVAVC